MLFADRPRAQYNKSPAHEVICQLQFPPILSINEIEPVAFQDRVRRDFPQYARQEDTPPPRLTGMGTPNMKLEQPKPVTNYHFLSGDGGWKLNLTRDFIALSTLRYQGWETFTRYLDKPLAAFIQIYEPAYLQRIGLRYRNIISRQRLGLEDVPWSELITPAYLGPLREEDIAEADIDKLALELVVRLENGCRAKIHAGPGRIKAKNGAEDPETKFILDIDVFQSGNIACTQAPHVLETLHTQAGRVFEGAVRERLRDAMS